jgi:hypothetical protein
MKPESATHGPAMHQQDGGAAPGRFHVNPGAIGGYHPACPIAHGILFDGVKVDFVHDNFLIMGKTLCIPTPERISENKKRAAHQKSALPFSSKTIYARPDQAEAKILMP